MKCGRTVGIMVVGDPSGVSGRQRGKKKNGLRENVSAMQLFVIKTHVNLLLRAPGIFSASSAVEAGRSARVLPNPCKRWPRGGTPHL